MYLIFVSYGPNEISHSASSNALCDDSAMLDFFVTIIYYLRADKILILVPP